MELATNEAQQTAWWRLAAIWCGVGVLFRLTLLLLAGEPELHQDEANYVYLALGWSRFGVLGDAERYLWPPLWPWTLRQCFELFGREGLFAAKLLLVFTSASVGASVVGVAARLANLRVAKLAGALWAFYLPLAGFTHLLWAESLFLAFFAPALYELITAQSRRGADAERRLLLAGLLMGASLLVKESALFLVPLLAVGLLLPQGAGCWRSGARRSSLFVLACAAVLAPWTARNYEVYGHFAPSGISLGANVYNGLNAHSLNFDVLPLTRREGRPPSLQGISREAFQPRAKDHAWLTAAEIPNTAQRSSVEMRRGLAWAWSNPRDLVVTRVKKLADFVLPTSYFVRHQGLRRYPGPLGETFPRRLSVAIAMLSAALLLLLAIPGVRLACQLKPPGSWVLLVTAGYFLATSLLVSSSRFRVPMLPALLILAALTLCAPPGERLGRGKARALTCTAWAALAMLWWIDLPELRVILEAAW